MKIAVIGCGSIGERHAKNLESLGHVVDRFDPVRFPGKSPYDAIIRSDAMVIAAPTSMHDDYMEEAVLYGKPFFVEKPIADNILGSVIEDAKKAVMCGYNLRYHSCVKKAKEWLDAGLIGKPIWANFTLGQYNDRPPYLRDGVILNWSHEIDLCLYLLGGASLVASSTRITNDKDDMSDILLWHENDCRSTIHLDYITKPERRYFTIVGTENSLTVNLVDRVVSMRRNYGDSLPDFCFCGTDSWNDNYIEEMQAFIDRIDGKETIGCSGEEGLEILKICLEVRKQAGLD